MISSFIVAVDNGAVSGFCTGVIVSPFSILSATCIHVKLHMIIYNLYNGIRTHIDCGIAPDNNDVDETKTPRGKPTSHHIWFHKVSF